MNCRHIGILSVCALLLCGGCVSRTSPGFRELGFRPLTPDEVAYCESLAAQHARSGQMKSSLLTHSEKHVLTSQHGIMWATRRVWYLSRILLTVSLLDARGIMHFSEAGVPLGEKHESALLLLGDHERVTCWIPPMQEVAPGMQRPEDGWSVGVLRVPFLGSCVRFGPGKLQVLWIPLVGKRTHPCPWQPRPRPRGGRSETDGSGPAGGDGS